MEIVIVKRRGEDRITARRADGSAVETTFPWKGPVPHDAVHYFVERGLALRKAFWGMVAQGHHPGEIAGMAKAAGHASAKRAGLPDPAIVELLQAERLVECFEADLWSGSSGAVSLLVDAARAGCEASHVPSPVLDETAIVAIRAAIAGFAGEWMAAGEGHAVHLEWTGE